MASADVRHLASILIPGCERCLCAEVVHYSACYAAPLICRATWCGAAQQPELRSAATSHGQRMRAFNVLLPLAVGALHSFNVLVGPKVRTPRAPAAVPFPPYRMPPGKLPPRKRPQKFFCCLTVKNSGRCQDLNGCVRLRLLS